MCVYMCVLLPGLHCWAGSWRWWGFQTSCVLQSGSRSSSGTTSVSPSREWWERHSTCIWPHTLYDKSKHDCWYTQYIQHVSQCPYNVNNSNSCPSLHYYYYLPHIQWQTPTICPAGFWVNILLHHLHHCDLLNIRLDVYCAALRRTGVIQLGQTEDQRDQFNLCFFSLNITGSAVRRWKHMDAAQCQYSHYINAPLGLYAGHDLLLQVYML